MILPDFITMGIVVGQQVSHVALGDNTRGRLHFSIAQLLKIARSTNIAYQQFGLDQVIALISDAWKVLLSNHASLSKKIVFFVCDHW